MNELDKEKLIEKDIKSIENRVRHAFNQGYEAGLKHGKEQEPLTDVLKKIEADIFNACSDKYHVPINKLYCVEIFEIIEKYRK